MTRNDVFVCGFILCSVVTLSVQAHLPGTSWKRERIECVSSGEIIELPSLELTFLDDEITVGDEKVGIPSYFPIDNLGKFGNFSNQVGQYTYYYTYKIGQEGKSLVTTQVDNFGDSGCERGTYRKTTYRLLN